MKIGNLEISTQELNELSPETLSVLLKVSNKKTTSKREKKPSINGASIDLEGVEVSETEEGYLIFKHKDFNSRKKGGYAKADLVTAKELFKAGEIAGTNRISKTNYVRANGVIIGENLVKLAEDKKLI